MKIRFLTFFNLLIVAAATINAHAHTAPTQPPLENFDKRKLPAPTPAVVAPQRSAAALLLGERVNGLRFQQDERAGTPRILAAQRGFLTGAGVAGRGLSQASLDTIPSTESHRIVKAFVNEHAALFGHDATALAAARIKVDATTEHNGLRTVIWQQKLDEIPVYGGLFISHRTKNDELVSISSRFVTDLTRAADRIPQRNQLIEASPINADQALRRAAQDLGEKDSNIVVENIASTAGAERKQTFRSSRLAGEAYTQLAWFPLSETEVTLCWQVVLTSRVRPEMYLTLIDAQTGEVLLRRCLTAYISSATYNVFTSDSPSPFSPGLNTPGTFQPPLVSRTNVTLAALSTNASPNGWINDGGNETVGNNVDAHLDRNDDNQPDLPRPQGNPNRVFDFPLSLLQSPLTYGNASVVNLFYWNNFCHDRLYQLGFTEAFGNFQQDNLNRGGLGADRVQADGQDGGGTDNANFATPPDGIPGRMQMYLFSSPSPDRDGSLDAEIMIHEYVHGLSNRLLGGGVGISELQTAGMGEGWSDFYALSLLSEATDDPDGVYASGGYATFGLVAQNYYFGIRRYPYTTDMTKNPLTLKDIDPTQADAHAGVPINPIFGGSPAAEVHNQGEVWCMTLWEARANLIEKLGNVAGNNLMLQLVTDGMKLAPENATFLEARDGILLADEILTGGDNLAELWFGFAKRGMGFSASVPPSDTTTGVVEAYDVPDFVTVGPPDGILEVKITPGTSSAIFGNVANEISVRITDGLSVTNATISSTLSLGGSLTFRNDGQAPDLTANNSIYTASYATPNVATNVTLTLVISAPGKDTSTNVVVYAIVPPPPNDTFTNATKIPAAGSNYVTLNTQATLEFGEPLHAGIASVAASLWWSYAPTADGPVLVDTAGSSDNTVLAVYTNTTLATLQPVVSANDIGNRQQAFVYFNGKAGTTYRIAVASFDANSTGTIRLAVTPGGIPDTNAPSVTLTSPLSGLTLTTNRLTLVGSAIDPDPSPSGLQEIEVRVNRINIVGPTGRGDVNGAFAVASLISTNWSRVIGLFEGLNQIEITVKDVAGNRSSPVIIQATYRPLDPPNDFFVNAIALTGAASTNLVNTLNATKEVNEPNHALNAGGKSAWWNYQPPADGELILSTTNSTFDTLLAVYTGSAVGSLTRLAENDDAPSGTGGISALALAVRSNQMYRIVLDGFDGAGGAAFLHHQFSPATVYHLTLNTTTGGTVSPLSSDVVAGRTVIATATPNAGYNFNAWNGGIFSLVNPLSIVVNGNQTITASFQPIIYTDGFESGNLTGLGWTTGGTVPWLVQNTYVAGGIFAARSGVIGASQSSSLLLSRSFQAGVGTFSLRVSSEPTWDVLAFYLDGVLQQQWSGEVAWTGFGFPLTAGTHTLEWRYSKDPNNNSGLDAAFIDNVNLPLTVAVNASTPAQLQARRQTDGLVFIDLLGQTNQVYVLQYSSDLQNWQTLATQTATGGFLRVLDPDSLTNPVRFYRAVTPVP